MIKLKHLILFTAIVYAFSGQAQWSKIDNPDLASGFGVSAMFTHNQTLWVGTTGRIFKSDDSGNNWTEVSTGLQSGISMCSGIVKQGNRYYASFKGNGNYYIYHTENEGQTWTIDTAGWPAAFGIKPATNQLLTFKDYVLARLESNFVVYKTNTDSQWNVLSVPNNFRTPGYVYGVGDTLVLGAGDIAMTTDMGQTWTTRATQYPQGMPLGFMSSLAHDRSNPSVLFGSYQILATSRPVLFVTRNNQQTWDSIPMDLDNPTNINAMYINGQDVYIAYTGSFAAGDTLKKVFHSANGGASWTNITQNLYSFTNFKFHSVNGLERINTSLFAGFSSAGVLKLSVNSGPTGFGNITKHNKTSFYPNPATNELHLTEQIDELIITNLNGQVVLHTKPQQRVDISHLPTGMYIVKTTKDNRISVSKLSKE